VSRRGLLLFAAMCVIWGIPYLLIRVAVRELTPATLVFSRTALAALLLVPFAAARGELRPLLRAWAPLLAYTVAELAIPWLLLARAEQRLTSSLTGLLIAAVPLVGAVMTSARGSHDRLDGRRWTGLLIGLLGVAALVGLDFGSVGVVPLLEVCVVVVGYAVGPMLLSRRLAGEPAMGVVAASLALTAVAYAPAAAVQWPSHVGWKTIGSVVALALVCTALAFMLFLALIAEVGPVRATVITYVNPAVAAVLGVAVLGERFTVGMAVGFALVLAGCVLATGRAGRGQPAPAPEAAPS
jgi:drug/metabolite transporter (DMT)-like permease